MEEAVQLIRTKLHPPSLRPGLVPRLRLKSRIEEGIHGPLTLVVAPAGFGKTTLLVASLTGCDMQAAWLSLEKDDNRAGRFLVYLVAALQQADAGIGAQAARLLAGVQQASNETVLTSLINDLDTHGREIALVLDDYQFIHDSAVHEAVTFLLEHCPPAFHLLIASRSDPSLPLARLRARGQMVELRAADLRFTAPEAAQFLNEVMGLRLDGRSIAILEERTEGWAAGLQMAALSMRDREDRQGFIEGFSGTNRHILDYLMEETLAGQPPEIQRFLLKTSVMERLSAPLCDSLLETVERLRPENERGEPVPALHSFPSSAPTLEYLERENLFLISLDDQRNWFRYHHLFADLLRARLHQAQPDLVPLLHRQAAGWLEQNGFILEAIQHLVAANETGQAADMIEHWGPARWAESDPLVMQMAESLPRELLIARAKLCLYQIWLLICEGDIGKAFPILKDLDRSLSMADPHSGQKWMLTITSLALAFLTPMADLPRLKPLPDEQELEEVPAGEPILRDAAEILYGMSLSRWGEIDRAALAAEKWIGRGTISRQRLAIPALVAFLARIYFVQGRLDASASLCRDYLDPIREAGNTLVYNAGNMSIVLGQILYERNCLEEAEKHIRDGLQANEPWKNLLTDAFGLIALTRVLLAKGDYAGARQAVDKFEARIDDHFQPIEFKEELRTLRVQLQLASGDHQSASRWADQIQTSEDFRLHEEYYRLTLARIRLAQGQFADVEDLLAGKSPVTRAGSRITRQIESNLLLAAAMAGLQRMREAFPWIEACLALAEPEGFVRIFLDGGQPVREMLAAYLRSESPGRKVYAQKLLEAFSPSLPTVPSASQPAGLIEPLTGRELEVLQLMALGRTNQQIAGQLFLAQGTVKAHAASIYRKLDAANRTEAVTRARQLGLLP